MKSTVLHTPQSVDSPRLMAERLNLTTSSLRNVIISNDTDTLYYEVVTPKWDASVTRVSRLDPKSNELEVVAELQNDMSSEKASPYGSITAVRLRGQQFRPTGDFWLRDGVAGSYDKFYPTPLVDTDNFSGINSDARFRGKDGKYYQWRQRKGGLEVQYFISRRLFNNLTNIF